MKILPTLVYLKIYRKNKRNLRLFLPVILLWPIVFLLLPLALIVLAVLSMGMYRDMTLLKASFYAMSALAEIRGTQVKVRSDQNDIQFAVY